jgi:diacylglycerol kinase (ATP)
MHIALVVNPKAGRNSGLRAAEAAERVFGGGGWRVTRKPTGAHGEAQQLAREAAGEGFEAVFACGGDGTLSQVVQGLFGTGLPAGLIPAGTGNDFARTVGLSHRPDVAARQALLGHEAEIDLLEVNEGAAWALNVMGVGFDARVAERINRRTRLTGGLTAYITAVTQELVRYRPTEVTLHVGNATWEGRAMLVAIANATCYGAGMRIAPEADITDGLLDVVLVEHIGRLAFVWSFPRVLKGSHLSHPAVHVWRAAQCTVETTAPAPVLVDGEVQLETPLHVRVAHRHARFWMPGAFAPATTPLTLQPSPEV